MSGNSFAAVPCLLAVLSCPAVAQEADLTLDQIVQKHTESGTEQFEFLDPKTFLPLKSTGKRRQSGQDIDYVSSPGNYKALNGVLIPYSLSQVANGKPAMDLTVEKVEINAPIEDSIFHIPEIRKDDKSKQPPK